MAYRKASGVLTENARPINDPNGVVAGDRYQDIWGRDGLVCSLAMSDPEDEGLTRLAEKTIDTLADCQSEFGQIPNKVRPDVSEVCFGKGGCVDASLWYPVAVWNHYRNTKKSEFLSSHKDRVREAVRWVNSLDQNGDYLLEANPGSDWFDLYRRFGRVLYSQILNYAALRSLNQIYEETEHKENEEILQRAGKVKQNIQRFFWPKEEYVEGIEREFGYSWIHQDFRAALAKKKEPESENKDYFMAAVDSSSADWRFDTAANCLSILFGIADENQASDIVNYMLENSIGKPYPAKSLDPPVTSDDPGYGLIFPDSDFLFSDEQDLHKERIGAGNYHNGGIWPWVGGFYVLALERTGKDADEAFEDLRKVNALNDHAFIEWVNSEGDIYNQKGTTNQSWSAANYILAHRKIIDGKDNIFDEFL